MLVGRAERSRRFHAGRSLGDGGSADAEHQYGHAGDQSPGQTATLRRVLFHGLCFFGQGASNAVQSSAAVCGRRSGSTLSMRKIT